MAEDNTAKCCLCIPINISSIIFMVFAFIAMIGGVLNILGTLDYIGGGWGIGGIILLVCISVGNLASIFCNFKFFSVFYAHHKKGDSHDDADRQSLVGAFKW